MREYIKEHQPALLITCLQWPQLSSVLGRQHGEILWISVSPSCRPEGSTSLVSHFCDTQFLFCWSKPDDSYLPFDSRVAKWIWMPSSLCLPSWTQADQVSPAHPRGSCSRFSLWLFSASTHGHPLRHRSKRQVASISFSLSNESRVGMLAQTQ